MKRFRTSIKKNKLIITFLISIIIIGFISGITYYYLQNQGVKDLLSSSTTITVIKNTRINNIIPHIIIISTILVLSSFIIGLPISIFYLFYEGFSLGFTITLLTRIYKLDGFIFAIKYFIIFKIIFIPLLIYLNIKLILYVKNLIGIFLYKEENYLKKNLVNNLKKIIVIFIFIIIYDTIIYLISPTLINWLFI